MSVRSKRQADSSNQNTQPRNIKCYHCHKRGHLRKDCWKLKKDQAAQN